MSDNPYDIDKRAVRRSFEAAAGTYDAAAVLQREVANRLLERLDYVKLAPRRILDLGAGTGWCTAALRRRYRGARVVALDLAHGMLQRARGRLPLHARWFGGHGFVCSDADHLPFADHSFDLIFSSLTLQWCGDLEHTFSELRRVLRPGGLLMFTTLGPDTLRELRTAWQAADDSVHVNRFTDMHDVGDALVRARWADPVLDVETLTLTYRDAADILGDLKNLGARNMNSGRTRGLTGRERLQRFRDAYEQFRNSQGELPLTYEVVYGHAWAPEIGGAGSGEPGVAVIPLDRIGRGRRGE